MHKYANPLRYQRIADRIFPWAIAGAIIMTIAGLYYALVAAPPDYQQGRHHLAPSACRDRCARCGSDRCGLHRNRPDHRQCLGQADVGHLLGMGRAPHVGPDPLFSLCRLHRTP